MILGLGTNASCAATMLYLHLLAVNQ